MKLTSLLLIFILSSISFAEDRSGVLMLCGGGTIPQKAISWVKDNSKNNKCIVVTFDSSDEKWANLFSDVKLIQPEELTNESIEGLGVLCINGGDQWKYINKLNGKVLDRAYKNGTSIIGTSAGAMILSEHYFSAEDGTISVWEALADKHVTIGHNFVNIPLLKNTIIDTHYTERNRRDRLKSFMLKSESKRGIGIDEGTSLCIDGPNFRVFGIGNVEFIFSE